MSIAFRHGSGRTLLACLACLFVAACSGSSGSGSSSGSGADNDDGNGTSAAGATDTGATGGGATAGGASGATTAGTGATTGASAGATTGTTDGATGGGDANLDGADLIRAGTRLPVNPVDTTTASLVSPVGRARAEAMAEPLAIVYEVTENHGEQSGENCASLNAEYNSCSVTNVHIKDANGQLNDGNWKIYFHSLRRILRIDSNEFSVSLVNGDLNFLEPSAGFTGFDGSVKSIKLFTEFSHLMQSDFLPRYWLVRDGEAPVTIANTDSISNELAYSVPISGDNRQAFNGEPITIASPGVRHARNASLAAAAASLDARTVQSRIIPSPRAVTTGAGSLDISGGFSFAGAALSSASIEALRSRQATLMSTSAGVPLSATVDASLAESTYTLDVTAAGITVVGADETALFQGAQSLLGLVQIGVDTIPLASISDSPRYPYRGMHVDIARNFQSAETLRRLLDQMAAYKLNRLHLHLADDEGWRLEIPSLPELTSIGARRAFAVDANGNISEADGLMPQLGSGPASNNSGSGFLSRAEFVDLLRYATARHIRIVPEFDMPGHSRAAVVAMRARAARLGTPTDPNVRIDDPDDTSRYVTIQHYDDGILNPCMPGTYNFIQTVVDETRAMYSDAGATLDVWHMGGDEANNVQLGNGYPTKDFDRWDYPWEGSPVCEAYIDATAGIDSRDDLEAHFVSRVSAIVANAGIQRMYAWHEIVADVQADSLSTTGAGVTYWRSITSGSNNEGIEAIDGGADYARRGFETVLSTPNFLYFDFPQEVDPAERGQYWATRYTDVAKLFTFAPDNLPQNAETSLNRSGRAWSATGTGSNPGYIGMQGHLWSELVRTPEQFDSQVYPRLLALAERAWHRASWERDYVAGTTYSGSTNLVDKAALASDYALFAAALGQKELAKLDAAGVAYRIPVPGATTTGGTFDMNSEIPGLPLEYSVDGSSFTRYQAGGGSASATTVRARSADGLRSGRVDTIE